jgi:Bacterial Ig-like domain
MSTVVSLNPITVTGMMAPFYAVTATETTTTGTSFDNSYITGLSAAGEAVGYYFDSTGFHSFEDINGTITPIEFSNASAIQVTGITADGKIFGSCVVSGITVGFVDSDGVFTTVNAGLETNIVGIDSNGDFFGNMQVDTIFGQVSSGFIDIGGTITPISAGPLLSTTVTAVRATGPSGQYEAVGYDGASQGFIDGNGTITAFSVPGSLSTELTGIDSNGDLFGWYTDSSGAAFGIEVVTGGVFGFYLEDIAVAGATDTYVTGANDAGQAFGYYTDSTGKHGFIYNQGLYTQITVANSTDTEVTGVTPFGQVVGDYVDSSGVTHAFSGNASPTVTGVSVTAVNSVGQPSANLTVGGKVTITLQMSEAVTVTGGTPSLTLNDGGVASYDPMQSTATSLVFVYTVGAGQNVASLNVTAANFSGATIADVAGNGLNFIMPVAALTAMNVSGSPAIQIDTTPPAAPANLADSSIANGYVNAAHDTANQVLTGSAEAGSTVTVYDGTMWLGTTAADKTTGVWSFSLGSLAEGPHSLTATATDGAGNVGVASTPLAFIVDTTPPAQPSLSAGALTFGVWDLLGSADASSTIAISDGAILVGTTKANQFGSWTFSTNEDDSAIRDFWAKAVDAAGNASAASAAYIEGTPGDDVFRFASEAELQKPAAIFGNGGSDTVVITTPAILSDADFSRIYNVPDLILTGASVVTLGVKAASAGISAVSAGNGATSVADSNLGTLAVDASAIPTGVALNLSGTESFNITGLSGNLMATNVTGSLGVETLATPNLSIAAGAGFNTIDASALTQGETLTLTGSHAASVMLGGNLSAGAYMGNLSLTATGTAAHTIATGGGKDTITATHGGDKIIAGGGGDAINVAGHLVSDTFVYPSSSDSMNVASGYDTIAGFSDTGGKQGTFNDMLDLSAIHGVSTIQGALGNANQTVAADSIAWIFNQKLNQTMVLINPTGAALSQTSSSLMAIDLTGGNFHLAASNFIA